MIIILVGNFKDKEKQREVSMAQAEDFRAKNKIPFFVETSAKTGENVEEIFLMASKILYTNFKDKIGTLVSASQLSDFFRKNRLNRRKSKGRNNVRMYRRSHPAVVEPLFL